MFIEEVDYNGLSNVLDINLKNYTYELNKVIEKSFDFMYEFAGFYEKYCIENPDAIDVNTLNYRIDKAYLDIAHIVYLENFKTFSIEVVDRGACDLTKIIGKNQAFNLLNDLGAAKSLSSNIIINLDSNSANYLNATELVRNFLYASNIFNQNYLHYLQTYNDVYCGDNNTIKQYNQYRFDLMGGGSLATFLNSLSATDRAKVNMLTNFIEECYNNLFEKLNLIVE